MKIFQKFARMASPKREMALIGLAILIVAATLGGVLRPAWLTAPFSQSAAVEISLSELAAAIAAGRVKYVDDVAARGELSIRYADGSTAIARRDPSDSLLSQLNLLGLESGDLSKVQFQVVPSSVSLLPLKSPFGFVLFLGLIGLPIFAAFRWIRQSPGGKKSIRQVEIPDAGFEDVAGVEETLQELREIVAFLKDKDKFSAVGAKMPKGVLMVGDPGTGKTLIARAVAGEAGVPFFAMSGSEFVEVFVGVGAQRVRQLFAKARKKAPCIIFIDEIDAVGRERQKAGSGAEIEQDLTLNQLLVEMDGFDASAGIVVLAATNRVDVLDPALTRPGRFDRQVYVHRPDLKGREAILSVHIQGKRLAGDVDLISLAKATPGLVGADLANIVNEAAINAVRSGRLEIGMPDFEEAVEKSLAGGVQRKGRVMSADEKRIIAYHEAGHAVVIHAIKLADPVYKITIIPRGRTAGYTLALPDDDRLLMSRARMLARITGLLGGRAAEELIFQDVTSGASNDLAVATQLAEEMVMRLGMDRAAGLRVYPQMSGPLAIAGLTGSQRTFEALDAAVRKILEDCYEEAKHILTLKRAQVERLADELLEVETVHREQFMELMEALG